jgi:hypothetical protein
MDSVKNAIGLLNQSKSKSHYEVNHILLVAMNGLVLNKVMERQSENLMLMKPQLKLAILVLVCILKNTNINILIFKIPSN